MNEGNFARIRLFVLGGIFVICGNSMIYSQENPYISDSSLILGGSLALVALVAVIANLTVFVRMELASHVTLSVLAAINFVDALGNVTAGDLELLYHEIEWVTFFMFFVFLLMNTIFLFLKFSRN